jgi:hypothetical protein
MLNPEKQQLGPLQEFSELGFSGSPPIMNLGGEPLQEVTELTERTLYQQPLLPLLTPVHSGNLLFSHQSTETMGKGKIVS